MSQIRDSGSGNGTSTSVERVALVIDPKLERHLMLRQAIRRTGLFSQVLSAESPAMAKAILDDPQTPELSMILFDPTLSRAVLDRLTQAQLRRSAVIADYPMPYASRPCLITPSSPEDIEALLEQLT